MNIQGGGACVSIILAYLVININIFTYQKKRYTNEYLGLNYHLPI